MSDVSQMFTCGPYSSAQDLRGRFGSAAFPPLCLLRGCVTASIHHPDMGALIETAWLDPVSG